MATPQKPKLTPRDAREVPSLAELFPEMNKLFVARKDNEDPIMYFPEKKEYLGGRSLSLHDCLDLIDPEYYDDVVDNPVDEHLRFLLELAEANDQTKRPNPAMVLYDQQPHRLPKHGGFLKYVDQTNVEAVAGAHARCRKQLQTKITQGLILWKDPPGWELAKTAGSPNLVISGKHHQVSVGRSAFLYVLNLGLVTDPGALSRIGSLQEPKESNLMTEFTHQMMKFRHYGISGPAVRLKPLAALLGKPPVPRSVRAAESPATPRKMAPSTAKLPSTPSSRSGTPRKMAPSTPQRPPTPLEEAILLAKTLSQQKQETKKMFVDLQADASAHVANYRSQVDKLSGQFDNLRDQVDKVGIVTDNYSQRAFASMDAISLSDDKLADATLHVVRLAGEDQVGYTEETFHDAGEFEDDVEEQEEMKMPAEEDLETPEKMPAEEDLEFKMAAEEKIETPSHHQGSLKRKKAAAGSSSAKRTKVATPKSTTPKSATGTPKPKRSTGLPPKSPRNTPSPRTAAKKASSTATKKSARKSVMPAIDEHEESSVGFEVESPMVDGSPAASSVSSSSSTRTLRSRRLSKRGRK